MLQTQPVALPRIAHEAIVAERRRERSARLRGYLHRFLTSWVAEDPAPAYSELDRRDGCGTDA